MILEDGKPSLNPDDYRVLDQAAGDQAIGRIYRSRSSSKMRWRWVVWGSMPKGRQYSGLADSLDEAKAAIRTVWERRGGSSVD
jgi:hypothetical protein